MDMTDFTQSKSCKDMVASKNLAKTWSQVKIYQKLQTKNHSRPTKISSGTLVVSTIHIAYMPFDHLPLKTPLKTSPSPPSDASHSMEVK